MKKRILRMVSYNWVLSIVLSVLFPSLVQAQFHRATDPVATPPSALIMQDDAMVIDVNPAALGFLPSWSLAYLHSEVDQPGSWLQRGDAFYMATPLLLGLAAGLSAQSIRPGEESSNEFNPHRGMISLGLALAPSSQLSFGGVGRVVSSGDGSIDALATTDFGVIWRPINWLGMSLLGRDLFATRSGYGTSGLELGPSVVLSSTFRPLGTRDLTLDFGLVANDEYRIGGRTGLNFAIPYVGSASAVAEIDHFGDSDEVLRVLGGLNIHWGMATIGGGVHGPNDFRGNVGWYTLFKLEGTERPGLPAPRYILNIELNGLEAREMVAVTLILERVLHDQQIAGVLLRPTGSGMGLAYAQEIRDMIRDLRMNGKAVLCHLESASGAEYYACAGADRVFIDPAGSLRLLGSSMSVLFLGDTLDKIGVHTEYLRIGAYKGAPEQLTQGWMGEEVKQQSQKLLDDVYNRVVTDLSHDLNFSQSHMKKVIDSGPHLAAQAIEDELVSQVYDGFEMSEAINETVGNYSLQNSFEGIIPKTWGMSSRIGLLLLDGTIIDGKDIDIPFLNVHFSGGQTVARALDTMAADASISAIVLRVDSPGGAAMASDQIWRAVRRARRRKPVIASMGAVAASGGYYVACGADEIWADPSTVTGSIGIFYGKFDVQELAKKVGIGVQFFKRGRMAGGDTMWRSWTPDERAALAGRIRTAYRMFLQRVADSRGVSLEQIDKYARGRVYTGETALRHGLIDGLGGLAYAVARARQLANVEPDTEVVIIPERKLDLLNFVLKQAVWDNNTVQRDSSISDIFGIPSDIRSTIDLILTLQKVGGSDTLAMMPYIFKF